jgi:hypothetical protein
VNAYEKSIAINYELHNGEIKSLEVEKNDTVLIYLQSYVCGTVGVSDDRDRLAITNVTVNNNDSSNIPITQNEWRYEKRGKYHAEYYLIIDATLFKKNN